MIGPRKHGRYKFKKKEGPDLVDGPFIMLCLFHSLNPPSDLYLSSNIRFIF